ncbi:MAG: bifunctional demethylmenaquinone methyltransferase/2-methoxy-6-polyprenyl-1,4-benzoquinol methylase UbiE [Acidobacteriaceae bacterium]
MKPPVRGAEPPGASDERSAGEAVQAMFNSIAPRYDLLNHVLSANVDRIWWKRTARSFRHILENPDSFVLDVCCGTGDMTLALLRHRPLNGEPVIALDFAEAMLARAREKFASPELAAYDVQTIQADALHMPLPDSSLDLITTAFGFRNLANYEAGLREFHRVLCPGAELGILDFSEPDGMLGGIYQFYFRHVLPRIGKALSGSAASYEYLPRSVHRFPPPQEMLAMLRTCGFCDVSWTPYTFGIAGLYRAVKA